MEDYDREKELKAFDKAKTSVMGLLESSVTKIPRIFIHDQERLNKYSTASEGLKFTIPIIDLDGIETCESRHKESIEIVRKASEKWGFFQVVNYGIKSSILEEMIDGVRRFHELDPKVRKMFYTRDELRSVKYHTNFDFYQALTTNWRDSFSRAMAPSPPSFEELLEVCK